MQNNKQINQSDISIEKEIAPYIDLLALTTLPFSASIPDKRYFIEPDRQQYLDQLSHLVQSSDMVLVVVGENGTGKTTLLQQFISLPNNNLKCCHLTAVADYSEHEVMVNLSRCLDLPDNLNIQVMHELIREQATQLQRSDIIPVLLVDNAYKLPQQTLNLILQLQNNQNTENEKTESPWRIILFTQPSHSPDLIQLKDRLHFIQLSGFGIEQTRQYLLHRLRSAGYKGDNPFSEKDLIIIQKGSQGNLVKIHQQAHEILLEKSVIAVIPEAKKDTRMRTRTPLSIFQPKVIMSIITGIAISAVLYFQTEINQALQQTNTTQTSTNKEILPLPAVKQSRLARIPDQQPVDWEKIPALSLQKTNSNTNTDIKTKTAAAKSVSDTKQPDIIKTPPSVTKKNSPVGTHAKQNTDLLETLLNDNHIRGKDWILQQNKNAATAQIMASSKPGILIKYANQSALKGKTAIYHILRKKSDWYVLIYGSAQNRTSMKNAVKALPAPLQKNRPWIRMFNDVQSEIIAGKK